MQEDSNNIDLPNVTSIQQDGSAVAPLVNATQSIPSATANPSIASVAHTITNVSLDDNQAAEDVDLIERAWVEKAKAIVNSTHGDPYQQNKELNKVKAIYIKKRFDKDLKVSD